MKSPGFMACLYAVSIAAVAYVMVTGVHAVKTARDLATNWDPVLIEPGIHESEFSVYRSFPITLHKGEGYGLSREWHRIATLKIPVGHPDRSYLVNGGTFSLFFSSPGVDGMSVSFPAKYLRFRPETVCLAKMQKE